MMGGDFDHRWTQTAEAVAALKELWTKDEAEFHGRYYDFPPVYSYPKPFQQPHPPILLGGNAANVLRRVARYADGWLPTRATPDQVEESRKILDALAGERGRDPASLTISVFGQPTGTTREQVDAFLNAGAEHVSVWPTHCDTEAEMGEQLEKMAEELVR
jgi:alkanesulfonate monooxygenase SsuD/methylene tetrahydromethanopterin reductase-like flavin-dependent oxidoreductase (luciferase family)